MAGYSGTPLAKKLGIEVDEKVLTVGAPPELEAWLDPISCRCANQLEVPQRGHRSRVRCHNEGHAPTGRTGSANLPPNGTIWRCWPKKASGMASGLQARDTVMNHMLPLGLVDVKVAAISDIRSGLKFVVRKDLR